VSRGVRRVLTLMAHAALAAQVDQVAQPAQAAAQAAAQADQSAAAPEVAHAGQHARQQDPTPLLTFAASQHLPPAVSSTAQEAMQQRLSRVTFDLSKDPPPDSNCAQTLGAKRFATLLDDLGGAYANLGDDAKAADAYAKAIGCSPRAAFLHAELAASLLSLGRYDEARVEVQREITTSRPDFAIHSLSVQLDFIAERWPEAITNSKLAVAEAPDDEQATYWQCFLWLAQKRMGTQVPVLATRHTADNWPGPVLESLEGQITETDLVTAVKSEPDGHRQREILTEALFYTGEQRLAAHQVDQATRYFTATVKLDVQYFIEHHLAGAELDKLRPGHQDSP
jgi:lipoprotein NlpI